MGFKLFVARHLATAQNKTAIFMGQGDYDVFDPNEYVDTFELNGINECLLLSSPLRRAIQTSQDIMSQKKDVVWTFMLYDPIKERGLGEFEGKPKAELNNNPKYFVNKKIRLDVTPPGAEPFDLFTHRVINGSQYIFDCLKKSDVLLVTHLQVIRTLICYMNNISYDKWYDIQMPYGKVVCIYEE